MNRSFRYYINANIRKFQYRQTLSDTEVYSMVQTTLHLQYFLAVFDNITYFLNSKNR